MYKLLSLHAATFIMPHGCATIAYTPIAADCDYLACWPVRESRVLCRKIKDKDEEEKNMEVSRRNFIKTGVGSACTLAVGAAGVQAQTASPASTFPADRMPEIPPEKMTPEQK